MAICKVTEWVDITGPREWQAKLECGHVVGGRYHGDSGFTDEEKAMTENEGNTVDCYECTRESELIERLKRDLSEAQEAAKARRLANSKGE